MDMPSPMVFPPSVVQPSPVPPPPPRGSRALTAAVVLVIVFVGLVAGYWAYRTYGIPGFLQKLPGVSQLPYASPSATPVVGSHVRWQEPEQAANLEFFPTTENCEGAGCEYQYFKLGTFMDGPYSGQDLYRVFGLEELGGSPVYLFVAKPGRAVMLQRHSDPYWVGPEERSQLPYDIDNDYQIPELVYPAFLNTPHEDFVLLREDLTLFLGNRFWSDLDPAQLVKAFDSPRGIVWTDRVPTVRPPDPELGAQQYNPFYGFYLQAPDGTVVSYVPQLPFIGDARTAIEWNDPLPGDLGEYIYYFSGGCGRTTFLSVVPPYDIDPAVDLVPAGRTDRGEDILVFRDSDREDLQALWDGLTDDFRRQYSSYKTFVEYRPMFFWQDPLGRLIRFQAKVTVPPAECGKPVIYLYPEQPTRVSVQVEPVDGMSVSDPEYGDGWNVTAYPDGRLVQSSDGREYPYLFWEGRGGLYRMPEKGWVVPRDGVEHLLDEKLAALGLIEKEIADFKEFWLSRMQSAPWYFITFMGNRTMNALAPLTVSPRPDTIIRVLMDYQTLQAPRQVEGFDIRTPERRGFTVVEWGGVLGR